MWLDCRAQRSHGLSQLLGPLPPAAAAAAAAAVVAVEAVVAAAAAAAVAGAEPEGKGRCLQRLPPLLLLATVSEASSAAAAGIGTEREREIKSGRGTASSATYLLLLEDPHPEGIIGSDSRRHCVLTAVAKRNTTPNIDHLTCRKRVQTSR